jgi:hypothetical protein
MNKLSELNKLIKSINGIPVKIIDTISSSQLEPGALVVLFYILDKLYGTFPIYNADLTVQYIVDNM